MASKTYFSRSCGLAISPDPNATPLAKGFKGEFKDVDGIQKRVDEKIFQFVPMGGFPDPAEPKKIVQWGSLTVNSERDIAYLDWRMTEIGDICDQVEFDRNSIPANIQMEGKTRVIDDQNRLIAKLQEELARTQPVKVPLQASK